MRWVLLLYALLCFLVAGGLIFGKSIHSTVLLGIFTLLFGIEIADFLYGTSQLKLIYPQFFGYYYMLSGLLYGPLLLWQFRLNLQPKFRFSAREFFHFIPIVVVAGYMWHMFAMPGPERIAYIKANFTEVIMPANYVRAFHILSYGVVLVIYFYQKRYGLSSKNQLYAWSVILIYFVSCVITSWFTLFANTWRDFAPYYFWAFNMVIVLGFLLYKDPQFLGRMALKYLKSSISASDKQRIKKKILAAFSEKEVFRRRDLSLSLLSDVIEEKSHHISQTFTEEVQESFQAFVNRHRVQYAKLLLTDSQYQNYTLEAIAEMAGFNNRVSFYNAFKQFTSVTPSYYQKSQKASGKSL